MLGLQLSVDYYDSYNACDVPNYVGEKISVSVNVFTHCKGMLADRCFNKKLPLKYLLVVIKCMSSSSYYYKKGDNLLPVHKEIGC